MWLLVTGCFFLFDPGQIQFRARVRLSSCFFYLLTQMKFLATPLIAKFSLEASLSEEALFLEESNLHRPLSSISLL